MITAQMWSGLLERGRGDTLGGRRREEMVLPTWVQEAFWWGLYL